MTDYKKMTKLMQARIDSLEPECDRLRKAIVDALAARDDTAPEIMERKLRKALEMKE